MNLLALLSSPTAAVVLLIGILFVVVVGYLVFYLECQRYAPREGVLSAVNRYALICTALVAMITLAVILNRPADSKDELTTLRAQLTQLQQEQAKLESHGKKREREEHRLLSVNKGLRAELVALRESNSALEQRVQQAAALPVMVSRLPSLPPQEDSAEAKPVGGPKDLKVAFQNEPKEFVEEAAVASESPEPSNNFRSNHDSLEQLRKILGSSINPAFQANQETKQNANKLIQELLLQLGYYDGAIDGNGARTHEAVVSFQEASALPRTGIVAKRTSRSLLRAFERSLGTFAASSAGREGS